jgi:3'-phosphoadenosine 5'-phosphosulfate sulfotransferase (PAPS reductase)/FAD synthetase
LLKLDRAPKVVENIRGIRPRSVVYLYSGGKDSSLALALTRDFIKSLCSEIGCKVYVVHIVVTGNSLPANTFCSQYVLKWHESNYGFAPVVLAASKSFPELMCKYGFQIMSGRWCWAEFKEKPLRSFEQVLPRPILEIDGMARGDSRWRAQVMKEELERVTTSVGRDYWAWHPLFSLDIDSDKKLELLKQYNEFECVANLYDLFNDSMNCVICPYKSKEKIMRLSGSDPAAAVYWNLIDACVRSERWREKFSLLGNSKKIVDYIKGL